MVVVRSNGHFAIANGIPLLPTVNDAIDARYGFIACVSIVPETTDSLVITVCVRHPLPDLDRAACLHRGALIVIVGGRFPVLLIATASPAGAVGRPRPPTRTTPLFRKHGGGLEGDGRIIRSKR